MLVGFYFLFFETLPSVFGVYYRETKAAAAANDCTTNSAAGAASKKI